MQCVLVMNNIAKLITEIEALLQRVKSTNHREAFKEKLNKAIGPYRSDDRVLRELTHIRGELELVIYYQEIKR